MLRVGYPCGFSLSALRTIFRQPKRNCSRMILLQLFRRDLARELQLIGMDMDKNVITRIETNKRYVTDFELQALKEIFDVSYDYLIDGKE